MAALSRGAQHYILLLIPSLLHEIERLGLKHVIAHASLAEREITALYFDAKSITQLLPDDPARIEPSLWHDLIHCVQLMQLLIGEAEGDALAQTRQRAVNKFLPQARQSLQSEFEKRRQSGQVDFRLASIARNRAGDSHAEETCMEALRLERQQRFESMKALSMHGLNWHQAVIAQQAKACVQQQMTTPPDDFASVDLLISLLDLLRRLIPLEQADEPDKQGNPPNMDIETVVMSLGNLLYRQELGLRQVGEHNLEQKQHANI
ncbi:hypothetical protein [Marinobacter fonticola]|uniref:hypothetical protein n=1 Tax=Marinobacter fonticola TaxID=2603215 RepID=UPI0011E6F256|nr:hypothetical protein [Marinobacter fonticola]